MGGRGKFLYPMYLPSRYVYVQLFTRRALIPLRSYIRCLSEAPKDKISHLSVTTYVGSSWLLAVRRSLPSRRGPSIHPAESPTRSPIPSRNSTLDSRICSERSHQMAGVLGLIGLIVDSPAPSNISSAASLNPQPLQPPPVQQDKRSTLISPVKRPPPPGVQIFSARCSEKGCVFPPALRGSGRCCHHDRQDQEPALFLSQQPSMLLLDHAKFGLADSEFERGGSRSSDRRRLARLWETFQEGIA